MNGMFKNLPVELEQLNLDDTRYDLDVGIKFLRPGAQMPTRAHPEDACEDIRFYPENMQPLLLLPGMTARLQTGVAVEIPSGWEMLVRPRSGLAAKYQLTVLNTPGTVDSNFRGEVVVIAHRVRLIGNNPNTVYTTAEQDGFTIRPGDRIAQICFKPVYRARMRVVDELSASDRGAAGMGSTGLG